MNKKAHVAYNNFSCLFENDGLVKVTGIEVHCNWQYLGNGACKMESLLQTSNRSDVRPIQ